MIFEFLQRNAPQLMLMAGLLCLSGCFSGSETALFSLKHSDLNRFRRRKDSLARAICTLHANLSDVLMTILFCNMVVNILFFASSATLTANITHTFGARWALPFGLTCLLLVITFGEVTPKTLATAAAPFFAQVAALPLLALHRALWCVRALLGRFVFLAERCLNIDPTHHAVSPEELRLLVEMSRVDGVISAAESDMIGEVLELPAIRTREIMTPRVDVVTVNATADIATLLALACDTGHSKLPVRDETTDEYTGWIDARDTFDRPPASPITAWVRPALFVSELDHADQVLLQLRQAHSRLAIVVDERGASEGILTLSDVVSEIFGPLNDEQDIEEPPVQTDGENSYRLSGSVSVREWRNLFGVSGDLPATATVGGLLTALLGRVPQCGDTVTLGNLRMEVTAMRRRRIRELHLTLQPATDETEASA